MACAAKIYPARIARGSKLLFPHHPKLWRPQQCALDLRVGEDANGIAGRFRVAGSLFGCVVERVVAVQNGQDVGMGDAIEGAIAQDGFDLVTLRGSAAIESMNHGHGRLAFAQIAGHRLAQHTFGSGEIEYIVHDLERHSQIASVLSQTLLLLEVGASEDAAHSHAYRK